MVPWHISGILEDQTTKSNLEMWAREASKLPSPFTSLKALVEIIWFSILQLITQANIQPDVRNPS